MSKIDIINSLNNLPESEKSKLKGRARCLANLKPKKPGDPKIEGSGRKKGMTFEETLRRHAELHPDVSFLDNIKKTFPELKDEKLTARDIICLRALHDAMKGAHNFADLIVKRLEGLPRQPISITQTGEGKLYIVSEEFIPEKKKEDT